MSFNNGCLFFGDRFGMVHVIGMMERREILCLFLSEAAEQFYKDHFNMYPLTLELSIKNHELGDYTWLP